MIHRQFFGKTGGGIPVDLYTLTNNAGVTSTITNYGGIVTSLRVPDARGRLGDVVLGFDGLSDYLAKSPYFGCLVGRYGNRIANARFALSGRVYKLAANDGSNHLHGGRFGFDKVVWIADTEDTREGPALILRYVSPDGEEGYPGTLKVTAVYTLTNANALRLDFTATTDRVTLCNLTHHSYFNLAGQGDILAHEVMIPSTRFTPVNGNLIPTGELRAVKQSPFDFTIPCAIGTRINYPDEQLKLGGGYDHNWVFDKLPGELTLAARITEKSTGREMEVLTTEPGMQFYSGNFLDGTLRGKGGRIYGRRAGFCMEPQHYPDSPNQSSFPGTVLQPGDIYRNTIIYRFGVMK